MKSSRRNEITRKTVKVAIAILTFLGALTTSFATPEQAAGACTVAEKPMMSCCEHGMKNCKMPQSTKVCACRPHDDSIRAIVATLPSTVQFSFAVAILPFEPVVCSQPERDLQSPQRIDWECDLPPPQDVHGLLPNRAPPSR